MSENTLRKCHCGGDVRLINPDNQQQFDRIIYCDTCTAVWCYATNSTEADLIAGWNRGVE